VPPRVVTNDDLVRDFGMETSDEWIQQRTGIRERRFADDGVGSADLGAHAAKAALEQAGLEPQDLDMIVFATLSPEHCFPGSGVFLQRQLGLTEGKRVKYVPCLDIRNQCSGFLYGTQVASALIQSRQCKHVLLVGAETHSHALDLTTRGRTVASLFGDGAGAAVFSATEEDRGVRGVWLGADGSHAEVLAQRIWDIRKFPFVPLDEEGKGHIEPEILYAQMDGKTVFKHAVTKMPMVIKEGLDAHGMVLNDIDMLIPHQANLRISQFVQKTLRLRDDQVWNNIQKFGNTTAASVPIALCEAWEAGKVKDGDLVCLAAFGSGFTWASALIRW